MARAARSEDPAFELRPLHDAPFAPLEKAEDALPGGPVGALHSQLREAYGAPGADRGLTARQRLTVIVGSAAALWCLIGLGIAVALA